MVFLLFCVLLPSIKTLSISSSFNLFDIILKNVAHWLKIKTFSFFGGKVANSTISTILFNLVESLIEFALIFGIQSSGILI